VKFLDQEANPGAHPPHYRPPLIHLGEPFDPRDIGLPTGLHFQK
jgi:hypothetical protein